MYSSVHENNISFTVTSSSCGRFLVRRVSTAPSAGHGNLEIITPGLHGQRPSGCRRGGVVVVYYYFECLGARRFHTVAGTRPYARSAYYIVFAFGIKNALKTNRKKKKTRE